MKKHALRLLLLAFSFSVFGQKIENIGTDQSFIENYVAKTWTTEEGLPGMTVNAVLQDKKGYIYIGTYDGLVRFDGIEFVNFTRNLDEKYDFVAVRSIFQDSKDNLWVGHNDEGVSCIKPSGEIIKFTTEDGLPHNSVRAICEDYEGNIWLGTASGLSYLTPDKHVYIPDGLKELGQETIQVSRLYCDTAGRIWISTANANELFVYSNKKVEQFTGLTKIKNLF